MFDENGRAHIGRICVRKAYRGRDLGRMIVEALESRLKKWATRKSAYRRKRVQQFYEKLGYCVW
ncbi:MAG: GNAT family N-acetyltransferase [Ruminococcus bicirculans (ex Wegman et al. 2014)]